MKDIFQQAQLAMRRQDYAEAAELFAAVPHNPESVTGMNQALSCICAELNERLDVSVHVRTVCRSYSRFCADTGKLQEQMKHLQASLEVLEELTRFRNRLESAYNAERDIIYRTAQTLLEKKHFLKAEKTFALIPGYSDADRQMKLAREAYNHYCVVVAVRCLIIATLLFIGGYIYDALFH